MGIRSEQTLLEMPPASWLQGGGEMGALMRSIAWERTPVGPIASWPQSLRTALSILLETRFPMYIAWGREFTQFYNDGYRPILGSTKHPAAMGRSTRETFAEIWDIIGPMFEGVLEGRAVGFDDFMLPLERHGFVEECYFIFSYSPIRDETEGVGGVLVTVTETTARVLGERRLRTMRDLAAVAAEASEAQVAWQRAAEVLATNPADLPLALLYAFDAQGNVARLAGTASVKAGEVGTGVAPAVIDFGGPGGLGELGERAGWPLGLARSAGHAVVIDDVEARFGHVPGGRWPDAVRQAIILPIGRPGLEHPYGFLVAGVSPRLLLDDTYRGFFGLVAEHIATALSNAHAREEERRRVEALAEIDRVKTDFFGNVSHEFRTPLMLLLGPAEEALAEASATTGPSGAELERWQLVHHNALRLLKLVNNLLDFSRIEAGRAQAAYAPVELGALTAEFASAFQSAIERAGLAFEIDCPPLPEPIWVDPDQWEKIVLNLLSNALKFTFEGTIGVSLRWCGDHVELAVRDTGIGIPEDELPHLFDRFHRVQGARARTHEGSGIGLALLHELVKMHGGSVAVASRLGQGSTFTISLRRGTVHLPQVAQVTKVAKAARAATVEAKAPARTEVELPHEVRRGATRVRPTSLGAAPYLAEARRWIPDRPETPGCPGSTARTPDASLPMDGASPARADGVAPEVRSAAAEAPAHILLVDDNVDMRGYIRRLLPGRWSVEVVSDGEAALAAALARPPDLVLTDVMMPRIDGFGLLRALRADERTRRVPVILLSARAGDESRLEGLEAGADDYLVKPFSARELVARVQTHLELGRLRRDLELERTRLYSLLMQVPAPIAVTRGPDHVYDLSNPLHDLRVGVKDPIGKPVREVLPQAQAIGAIRILDEVYATGRPFQGNAYPVPIYRGDSGGDGRGDRVPEERFFDWSAVPLRDSAGQVEGILHFAYDVTEFILARRQAEQAEQALHEENRVNETLHRVGRLLTTELELERLVQMITDEATALCRAEFGAFFYNVINDRGESYLLYTLSGVPRASFAKFPAPRNTDLFAPTFRGDGVLRLDDVTQDPRYGHNPPYNGMPKGHLPVRSYLAIPVVSRSGEVLGGLFFGHSKAGVFTARDEQVLIAVAAQGAAAIDNARLFRQTRAAKEESLRLFEEARKSRATAESASRAKDEFLAILGHELRNPLAPIMTALHLMSLRDGDVHEKERTVIERQVTHLTRLVDDLLDVSRITRGKVELKMQRVELADVVAKGIELASPLLEQRQHVLTVSVSREGLAVNGDPVRLGQVVSNLLTNAAKYTEIGGRITVQGTSEGAEVVLRVRDTGIGITPEMLPRVFDLFIQEPQALDRSQGGLGLGLPIVRSLVALHGGTVNAYSEGEGQGTEFTIRLPAAPLREAASDDLLAARPIAAPRGMESRRVLIVDDNEDAVELLAESLELLGHVVRVAYDGPSALRVAATFVPEVALLDIGLPVMDGYELARRLREHPGFERLRLVAVTGYGQDTDRQHSQRAGFDAHLVKPVQIGELVSTIQELTRDGAGRGE